MSAPVADLAERSRAWARFTLVAALLAGTPHVAAYPFYGNMSDGAGASGTAFLGFGVAAFFALAAAWAGAHLGLLSDAKRVWLALVAGASVGVATTFALARHTRMLVRRAIDSDGGVEGLLDWGPDVLNAEPFFHSTRFAAAGFSVLLAALLVRPGEWEARWWFVACAALAAAAVCTGWYSAWVLDNVSTLRAAAEARPHFSSPTPALAGVLALVVAARLRGGRRSRHARG